MPLVGLGFHAATGMCADQGLHVTRLVQKVPRILGCEITCCQLLSSASLIDRQSNKVGVEGTHRTTNAYLRSSIVLSGFDSMTQCSGAHICILVNYCQTGQCSGHCQPYCSATG